MPISFGEIPSNLRSPIVAVEFDSSRAARPNALLAYRVLVVGQKLAAGTQPALTPVRVTQAAQAKALFGRGSMLAHMVERLLANNGVTETHAVALDDLGAGVAASGELAFSGTVTAAGTLCLYLAGRRLTVGVASGQATADIAAAVAAAVENDADLPVSAAAASSTVTLTARHKGECGNGIDLRINHHAGESLPAGLAVSVTAMSGGTGNPDVTDLVAALGDEWYHVIAWPYTDAANLSVMEAEMASRFGPMRMIDGMLFAAARGTHAELGALGDSRNSKHLCLMDGHGIPESPWEVAAAVAGTAAYHGNIDPARPFQTLVLRGITAPRPEDRFTYQERNLLLYDGVATHRVDAGGQVLIDRLVTTYRKNPLGADDTSYLDVTTPLTLMYLRYSWRTYITNKYPRHKLADDGTLIGAGQATITPKIGKAEAIAWFRSMEELGLVEGVDQFKDELICERNPQDPNRLDWMLPPNLVNQFVVAGVQIGFLLY